MTHLITSAVVFYSILFPTKNWFAPDQAITIHVKSPAVVTLVLTTFDGQTIDPNAGAIAEVSKETTVDLKQIFPLSNPGTFVLYAVPKGAALKDFLGTPVVVDVRADDRLSAPPGPMVIHLSPLVYAQMTTAKGPMTIVFYYDAAPHTVTNFIELAQGGFYDGLTFDKVVKDFIIQGGDPRGDGTGGPGYRLAEEFNDKRHEPGVLSMARQVDPNEPGTMPRSEYANSAGSQFFICLNRDNCKQLDHRYTAFGFVAKGMQTVRAIAAVPVADPRTGRPRKPVTIDRVQIKPVTSNDNPYAILLNMDVTTTTQPTQANP